MGWPQAIVLVLLTAGVVIHMCRHNQPNDNKYHWPSKLVAACIWAGLLYWGGFWDGVGS